MNILILKRNNLLLSGLLALLFLIATQMSVYAWDFGGGWTPVKTVGDIQSWFTVGDSTVDADVNVGEMSTVVTGTAIPTSTLVTLNGNLTSMGVASGAYVRFEYGTTPSMGSFTTQQTQAGIGAFTDTVPTPGSDVRLYYRSVTTVGAVSAYGATKQTNIPSGTGGLILKLLLRVALAMVILVGVIRFGGWNPYALLLAVTIGLITFVIIDTMLINLL